MDPQQSPPQDFVTAWKQRVNVLFNVCRVVSFPVVVCTTRLGTWGTRFVGPMEVLGLFWPPLLAVFFAADREAPVLFTAWYLVLGLFVSHLAVGQQRRRDGYRCHSAYWGESWLERSRGLTDPRKARQLESLLALFAGFLLHSAEQKPLGALLLLGAAAKLLLDVATFRAVDARVRQMEDGRIENETYVGLYRDRQNEIRGEN